MTRRTGYSSGTAVFMVLACIGCTAALVLSFGRVNPNLSLGISLFAAIFWTQVLYHFAHAGTVIEVDETGITYYWPFAPKVLWAEVEELRLLPVVHKEAGPHARQVVVTVYSENTRPIEIILRDPDSFFRRANALMEFVLRRGGSGPQGALRINFTGMRYTAPELLASMQHHLENARLGDAQPEPAQPHNR